MRCGWACDSTSAHVKRLAGYQRILVALDEIGVRGYVSDQCCAGQEEGRDAALSGVLPQRTRDRVVWPVWNPPSYWRAGRRGERSFPRDQSAAGLQTSRGASNVRKRVLIHGGWTKRTLLRRS